MPIELKSLTELTDYTSKLKLLSRVKGYSDEVSLSLSPSLSRSLSLSLPLSLALSL